MSYLKITGRPAVVILGNAMCSRRRIVSYLKAMLGNARHEVMFVRYQAQGTPGSVIQPSADAGVVVLVEIEGERHEIKAKGHNWRLRCTCRSTRAVPVFREYSLLAGKN